MEHEHIPFDEPFKLFDEHLNIKGNHRILFSGKYGTGKTYFLNKFFEEKEGEYYKIHITPTNYVTTPTHDIMKLIKFDLFYHLVMLNKDLVVDFGDAEGEDGNYDIVDRISKEKLIYQISTYAMAALAYINTESMMVAQFVSKVPAFVDKYKEAFQKSHETNKAREDSEESKAIDEFIESITKNSATPYEHDLVTQIIDRSISQIRVNGKKVVLLIDDLDRVDPENIFRILNVFSTYNNYSNGENKFGVDKVIVVCDLDNIRSIYEHRFGDKADFGGYIDKFYTHRVYEYDNVANIEMFIYDSLLKEIDEEERAVIALVCAHLVKQGLLNLRSLCKNNALWEVPAKHFYCQNWETSIGRLMEMYDYWDYRDNADVVYNLKGEAILFESDLKLLMAVKKLVYIVGKQDDLTDKLNRLKGNKLSKGFSKDLDGLKRMVIKACAPFIILSKNGLTFCLAIREWEKKKMASIILRHPMSFELLGSNILLKLKWNASEYSYDGSKSILHECEVIFNTTTQELELKFNMNDFLDVLISIVSDMDPTSGTYQRNLLSPQ